uniref:Ig-like domain-containing protein n=1 Tax=Electrophorus electricus TaxID=8005 RepID=A0A4W4EDW2_ELEEL
MCLWRSSNVLFKTLILLKVVYSRLTGSRSNVVFLSLDVFIFAAGSSTSTERVVMYSTVGKSLTFPTRVPLTGTIHYEGRNIGVVLNKNTDTETDEKFKNRLHWDNQTGLFTLSDLRTEDSGGYTVESSKESKIKQEYQLEVYKNVPAPQVTSSSNSSSDNTVCSLLCSVINGRGLVLFWYKDNFILNRTSSSNLNAILHLPLEIEKPKNDNFICVVSNPVSNKTTTANITTLCYHILFLFFLFFFTFSIISVSLNTSIM